MDLKPTQRVVTVFRSHLRPDAPAHGYADLAARMEERARAMPGFVDFKGFAAPDGERVSIIIFDNWDHHRAWRDDPEHRAAQQRGRRDFYADYSIHICEERRHRGFFYGAHRNDLEAAVGGGGMPDPAASPPQEPPDVGRRLGSTGRRLGPGRPA